MTDRNGITTMTVSEIKRHAKAHDIHWKDAVQLRVAYLTAEMRISCQRIDAYLDSDDPVAIWMASYEQDALIRKARKVRKLSIALSEQQTGITDQQIEQARSVPIEQVIPFQNGVARCFAHQDKRPSLSHWKKANKASCFVCNRHWNPIDVLVERDGMTFAAAVRSLA